MISVRRFLFLLMIGFLSHQSLLYSQNARMDGYKGIWYSSGQAGEYGYKFSGGVATFASRHRPNAIYSPETKKTFFVYSGTTHADERHLLIMISYFDHRLHVVPKPVIVYDKMGVSEPQDNASLSIDKDGYLWVFISGRGRIRPGHIFKSTEPYSIDSFQKISDTEMLSPQPWWNKETGFLLMFSKATQGRELFFSSSSDGETWSDPLKVASMGGHFQVSGVFGNKLVAAFDYHPQGNIDKRTNIYLIQTVDFGRTWKTIDNKIVELPLTDPKNEALVCDFQAERKLVYLQDLNFDRKGNPVLLILASRDFIPGPQGDPREWMVVSWKDQRWNFSKVCESTNNYDMGSIYIHDDEWRIIGPTEPGPQIYGTGGEVALWTSLDEGVTWNKIRNITVNSPGNNSFVRRPLNEHKEFAAFWSDGNADNHSISQLYFTNEKCNKVWLLPYYMKGEYEKPIRVR